MIKSKLPVFSREFSVEGAADGRDPRPQKGDAVSDGSSLKGRVPRPASMQKEANVVPLLSVRFPIHPPAIHAKNSK